ncbi:MAG: ABC transporter ATP-binding protein [Lentisphaerae bacterium]|nr:ABC transporter ATP-binding protein [Lentisphaerota bacterium]
MKSPLPATVQTPVFGRADTLLGAFDAHKIYTIGVVPLDVLRGVTLEIGAGERVAIVGASGAGKSTLLNVLGGLDEPTYGTVRFQGRDLYGMSASRRTVLRARHLGFVFQSYHLLPELDVLDNVILPAMNPNGRRWERFVSQLSAGGRRKTGAAALQDRAMDLLHAVGLAGRAAHLPTELSGGEQQRVALARALMNEPDVVLADEPTGNLDSVTGDQVMEVLFSLIEQRRKTLVLVTHNREIAGRCDRTLELKDGCLVSSGDSASLSGSR